MKHIELRKRPKREVQYFAGAISLYIIYSVLIGSVYKFQYFESSTVRLSADPEDYWLVISLYTTACIWMFFYSIVGFPILESYFTQAHREQTKELGGRTLRQKIFMYLVVPVVVLAIIMGFVIYLRS